MIPSLPVIPRLPVLRRTLAYFLPDRGRIVLLVGLIGLSTLLGLMQVWPLALPHRGKE